MFLKYFFCLLLAILACSGFSQIPEKTIVLDPGHGGKDNGTVGHNSVEKELTLTIAKELQSHIQSRFPYIKVILTRETDEFIRLIPRAKIANDNKVDLFISIHCNHHELEYVNGTEVYVLGLSKADENLDIVKRENNIGDIEHAENLGDNESHILFSMMQHSNLEKSLSFANEMASNMKSHTQLKQRGVKQAGFSVLKRTTMPSILIETGYLSNNHDESYLLNPNSRSKIVQSMMESIHQYLYPEINHQSTGDYFSILLNDGAILDTEKIDQLAKLNYITSADQSGKMNYYTGKFYSFKEAEITLAKLRSQGFTEAKILLLEAIPPSQELNTSK